MLVQCYRRTNSRLYVSSTFASRETKRGRRGNSCYISCQAFGKICLPTREGETRKRMWAPKESRSARIIHGSRVSRDREIDNEKKTSAQSIILEIAVVKYLTTPLALKGLPFKKK